jgi:hypothetical protein
VSSDTARGTHLNQEELRSLSSQGIIKTFPRNTIIVSEGDETTRSTSSSLAG